MTARILAFPVARIVRIPPVRQYSDECIRYAREIEKMFQTMEDEERFRNAVSIMHGSYNDKPCDSGDAA